MNISKLVLILAGLLLTVPTLADNDANSYQARAILDGQMADAEQQLLGVLEQDPDDPYALLNLAFIYQKAGEKAKAQELYAHVLNLPDNPLSELASGESERVKSIARRGLAHIATQ